MSNHDRSVAETYRLRYAVLQSAVKELIPGIDLSLLDHASKRDLTQSVVMRPDLVVEKYRMMRDA